jgi:hypothetical protein
MVSEGLPRDSSPLTQALLVSDAIGLSNMVFCLFCLPLNETLYVTAGVLSRREGRIEISFTILFLRVFASVATVHSPLPIRIQSI